ncbi:MAG TPA: zinc ribbon domain-containing protein [Victivallales bacterium]|nr:zinc ribbon domain-containing protein [Victivallales bacterium]
MLIKCPKCSFENQLGSIFCRNCGEKLNIDSVRPKVADKATGFNFIGLLRNLLGLLIFVGIVGIIAAMFMPVDASLYQEPSSSDQEAAKTKIKNLINRVEEEMGDNKFVFSPAEATFAYNDTFLAKTEGETGAAYAFEKISFGIDPQGFVHILLSSKLGGKVPTKFELKGILVNPAEGETGMVSFKVSECKMGKMPIKFVEDKIIEKFIPALSGGKLDKIVPAVKKIEVTEDKKFEITVK